MPKVENKIEVKGWSGKGFRSKVVLEGPKNLMDALSSNEYKSAKTIWKRDDNFKKLLESTENLFNDLLGNAGFKEVIYRMFARKDFARKDEVSLSKLMQQELRRKFLTSFLPSLSTAEMDKMRILIRNLVRLNRVYSAEINLRKKEDDTIFIEQGYGLPSYEFFKMEGQNITRIVSAQRDVSFFRRVTKYQCFFNEIEIEDETALDSGGLSHPTNPLFEILSLASNVSPTIVKYTRPDGFKKMLICLPPDLDITTVTKKYGALISKAHRDFYKREFRGRPQPISKDQKRKLILKIWKEKFEGKERPITGRGWEKREYTITGRCAMTSEILKKDYNITLAPRTLRRHYLKEIKGESGQ